MGLIVPGRRFVEGESVIWPAQAMHKLVTSADLVSCIKDPKEDSQLGP